MRVDGPTEVGGLDIRLAAELMTLACEDLQTFSGNGPEEERGG